MWPVHRSVLMNVPQPRDGTDVLSSIPTDVMENVSQEKRAEASARVLGKADTVEIRGVNLWNSAFQTEMETNCYYRHESQFFHRCFTCIYNEYNLVIWYGPHPS